MTRTQTDANATPACLPPDPASRQSRMVDLLRGTVLDSLWSAVVLLAVGLIVTVLASLYIKAGVESAAQRAFGFTCNEIQHNIDARLEAAAQVLRSGAALFDASEIVSREEWRNFTKQLQTEKYLPGIQGIGFALLIPPGQLAQHIQEIRREGFPDYQVTPEGERETTSAIIYLEPFSGRNLRAFGYDMLSEPVRRAAMERARDEDAAALSGKVLLVQETGQDVQAGALMYVPVYRRGLPIETIEQRRVAIQGWVYSPYRMTDLMRGALGGWDVKPHSGSHTCLQIYDGHELSADTLLYDSHAAMHGVPAAAAQVTRLVPIEFAGHRWTLRFTRPSGLVPLADYGSAWFVLFGGSMLNLMVFGLMLWRQQRVRFYRERLEAGDALRASELRYRRLFESAKDGILILDADTGMIVDVNPFLVELLGYTHEAFLGKAVWEIGFFKDIIANQSNFAELRDKGYVRYEDLALETSDGRRVEVEFVSNTYLVEQCKVIQCNIRDITRHKQAEKEREALQMQLSQAQKMESVGRLAGGVAHDFNNLLMGIMGYVELCQDEIEPNHPIREWLDDIMDGARRSAEITGQLLAFARKQTIAPKVLDLNDAVAGMLKLLRHLIGEDINLVWQPGANLHAVRLDPSQVDQILANLCVNARDAIGGVGKITLETVSVTIGADYCRKHAEAVPGAYVCLAISDDGHGMDRATLAQIFEPFFTTKETGQGTGLGMATVYGIVKQNNGFIYAYSEPGHGTTFKIYLPQVRAETATAAPTSPMEVPRGHGETILLVEDEKSLRVTCGLFLEALGYAVLKAETPGDALKTVAEHPGDIHLLLTDVILPGMNGRQLSERVRAVKPDVKVLFMSGYTADVIAQRGVLEANVAFIGKPFTRDDLAHKVREVLDARESAPA